MKLTSENIKNALPGTTLRDSIVPGLHMKVQATKRAYYLYYRNKDRQERRPKIGDHTYMTISQARATAKKLLLDVALGHDPSGDWRARRNAPTVATLVEQYKALCLPRRKSGTQHKYLQAIDKHILPELGKKRVSKVELLDISQLHAKIGKKAPVQANRVVSVASAIFTKAEAWKMRPQGSNPCKYVERYPEEERRRYMTAEEARKVAQALAVLRTSRRYAVDFILLLLLTGARKGEIAAARWEHYHGDRIELPAKLVKNKARTIYLAPPAKAIIDALPRLDGTIIQIVDPMATWKEVRKMTGLHDLRIHDLRHTHASVLLDQGYGLSQIGQILGHTQVQTTKRYSHLMREKGLAASTDAANQLIEWMKQ